MLILGFFFAVIDFEDLAKPLSSVGQPDTSTTDSWIALSLVHLLGLFYVSLQRRAIEGGKPAAYLRTLPIIPKMGWRATLRVLLIANGLFWLYLALPVIFSAQGTRADASASVALVGLIVIDTALLLLLAQAYWLSGRRWVLPAVVSIDFAFSYLLGRLDLAPSLCVAAGFGLLLGIALTCPVSQVRPTMLPNWLVRYAPPLLGMAQKNLARNNSSRVLPPVPRQLLVQQRLLIRSQALQTGLRGLFGGLVALTAWTIITFGRNYELAPSLLVIVGCLVVLLQTGSFRALDSSHRLVLPYLRTLPMAPMTLPIRDLTWVALICIIIMMPLSVAWLWQGHTTVGNTGFAWGTWLTLLVLLYPVSTKMSRDSVTLTTVLTLGWITAALAL
ncbi:MAG TPA: hypothetical protein DDY14_16530 [Chromatiaceae bacterium]|nr:MAG: hypothetical protein N838_27550 [Thiohalocapsa sp. PB-PSB1]QQO54917.1 MAG: hypothetical protein N838_17740 [Thiohalocapsa sp. PB-PSB1]HBG96888.1 hypothetical protein [Chromatiaceae bacterium]HCS88984.1 hypothetical protein [Chromatiaceae bacterium]